jgi:hypothetical protein
MKCRLALLTTALLLAACSTTTLYSGHFDATNSAGQDRQFVLYWNTTTSAFWGAKASPVTVLTQCSSRTMQYEEEPVAGTAPSATEIVFRGEPGSDHAADSNALPPGGVCGRVLSADRLTKLTGPRIEFTVSCKPVAGNPFAATDDNYLEARAAPYTIDVTPTKTKNLQADTPKRPSCGSSP